MGYSTESSKELFIFMSHDQSYDSGFDRKWLVIPLAFTVLVALYYYALNMDGVPMPPGERSPEPIGGIVPPDDNPWPQGDPNPNPSAPGRWKPPVRLPGNGGPGPFGPH